MARLRQQHPQNYVNSGNIHTDFENVIRYLNTAELGNKTVAELLSVLFNEAGEFRGPIEFRVDTVSGLQYRVGQYASSESGWITLYDIASLRGPSGSSVGNVEGPFFYNRQDKLITTGVASAAVGTAGSGYTTAPTVTFSAPQDGNGTRPTATATINGSGAVTGITIVTPGVGYTQAPTVTIQAPQTAGGVQATATATLAALTSAAATVPYSFDPAVSNIVVYQNGLLLVGATNTGIPSQFTYNTTANTVTLTNGVVLGDKVTIYSIRSQAVTNFRRQDTDVQGSTTVIPFVHTEDEKILVWLNGVLQEEGGAADYLASPAADTITFLNPAGLTTGDKVTVLTVENTSLKTVAGLMFEDDYTNAQGYILWNKLAVAANEIPQSKVAALATTLAAKANMTIASSTPQGAATSDLWLDTSKTPVVLKFYDGTQWLQTSPDSSLPTFLQSNAGQYVRVNGTGTALEYGNIDFSAVVPKTYMGAANGVATLGSGGKMPVNQLPDTFATYTLDFFSPHEDSAATVTNKTYFLGVVYKQKIRIDGITAKLVSGTCTIQLAVDGSTIGTTFAVTNSRLSQDMPTVLEVDGTSSGRRLELVVTSATSANTLEVGVSVATLNI